MSGIVGSKLNIRGSGLVGSLGTDGQVLTSGGAGAAPAWEDSGGGVNTPAFFASLSENQVVSTTSATKLEIDAEEFDSDGTYDNSTNFRFTPAEAGKYFIFANGYLNSMTDNRLFAIYIYKNGASIATARNDSAKTGNSLTAYTSVIDTSDADDYYEVYLYHNEGGDLTVPGSGEARSYFGAYKIIGA